MPRPCQKRRVSAAANRKPKPAGPPPIRHKARQKAIHNARRGRGRTQNTGGRPSRNQQSGPEKEQDFISLSNKGNNFHMLNGAGSQHRPIALDDVEDSELEDGELMTDDGSDSDDMDDLDMYDAEDMMINVQMDQPFPGRGKARRAEVMFTVPDAVFIYQGLRRAGFPLHTTRMTRYGLQQEDASPDSAFYISLAPSPISRQPSISSATSATTHVEPEPYNPASDYVFNWGKYAGTPFSDVPEIYLRTIGGQLDVYETKHPGLREAFEYHRPGQARAAAPSRTQGKERKAQLSQGQQRPTKQPQNQQTQQPPTGPRQSQRARSNPRPPSEKFVFKQGAHKGKSLRDVPENYLRTLEGMPSVIKTWRGLKEALEDFNNKTGRRGRV